jgi:hypothetical protein
MVYGVGGRTHGTGVVGVVLLTTFLEDDDAMLASTSKVCSETDGATDVRKACGRGRGRSRGRGRVRMRVACPTCVRRRTLPLV